MADTVTFNIDEAHALAMKALTNCGTSEDNAEALMAYRAAVLSWKADDAFEKGDLPRALGVAVAVGDRAMEGAFLGVLGQVLEAQGDHDGADATGGGRGCWFLFRLGRACRLSHRLIRGFRRR